MGGFEPFHDVWRGGDHTPAGRCSLPRSLPTMARLEDIVVRPWRRGDTRRAGRWPAPSLPAHWVTPAEPTTGGQRENWAISYQGSLVGKLSLYDHGRHHLHSSSARLGVFLRPDMYGQGIGSGALNHFFAVCPVGYLRLDVASDNQRAIRCYKRAGFNVLFYIWGRARVAYIEMERYINAPDRTSSSGAVQFAAD